MFCLWEVYKHLLQEIELNLQNYGEFCLGQVKEENVL